MFLNELKNFSRSNWWVYALLSIALIIVYITWKWNMLEIIILFLANFLWNLFIMVMQANYTSKNNKIWAIYHVSATITFTFISIYGLIKLNQSQYIIWQISYALAALKAFTYYNFEKDIKFINAATIWWLNIILFIFFISFAWKNINVLSLFNININAELFSIIMAIWFSFVTTGLVSINDKLRYWFSLIWVTGIITWSTIWVFLSYLNSNIDWVALWYMILTLTVLIYYIKLLPKYLKCNNT